MKLNALTRQDAAEDLADALERIEFWEAKDPSQTRRRTASTARNHLTGLAEATFEAAALSYRLEGPEEDIKGLLRRAGEYAVLELEDRRDPIQTTSRNFYDMIQRVLGLVVGWCDIGWRRRLVALEENRYHWPHDPKWIFARGERQRPRSTFSRHRVSFLRFAIGLTAEQAQDRAQLLGVLDETSAGKGAAEDRVEAGHCLRAVLALVDGDSPALNAALAELLALHARSARRGHYRTMPEGVISMNAAFLVRMGLERGLDVHVSSPYLPMDLIESASLG